MFNPKPVKSRLPAILIIACSTISIPQLKAQNNAVQPIPFQNFNQPLPTDASALQMASILLNSNRYALTTWYSEKGFQAQTGQYLTFGGIAEANIRPNASEAFALAISLRTGVYDATVTGVSVSDAQQKALKLITSLAYRHRTNTSNGWGNDWQTALWAAYVGIGGWLMWDTMTPSDQGYVKKMVEYEANRFIGYKVPYFRDEAGSILTPGDTKAEENAWNSSILQIAVAMMPNHANRAAWEYKCAELQVSSYASPANVSNTSFVLHGRSLTDWLYGSNANADFTVINHDRIHPDYMASIGMKVFWTMVNPLAGTPIPNYGLFNLDNVYRSLIETNFVAGSKYPNTSYNNGVIQAPGGTIYLNGSADIYYPQGNDWGTHRRMHLALLDAMVEALSTDQPLVDMAKSWESLHAGMVLTMQGRFSDGRTYGATSEDTYLGREEWVAGAAAVAYLTKWLKHQVGFSFGDVFYPIVMDNADRGYAAISGKWTTASWVAGTLGTTYVYKRNGNGGDKVRFSPVIPTTGSYKVYAWWPAAASQASNAPYIINHTAGSTTVRVNQRENGGQWNMLGTFQFNAGNSGYVEITNAADGNVVADGLKFEKL